MTSAITDTSRKGSIVEEREEIQIETGSTLFVSLMGMNLERFVERFKNTAAANYGNSTYGKSH